MDRIEFNCETGELATVAMTQAEIDEATPTDAQLAADAHQALKSAAISALFNTDTVAYRCFKAGIAYPSEWQAYTLSLRSIVNSSDTASTALPAMPGYPSGT